MEEDNARARARSEANDLIAVYQQLFAGSIAPIYLLPALVHYNPDVKAVGGVFGAIAPILLAQTDGTTKQLAMMPNGVAQSVFPDAGNDGALDVIVDGADREGALKAARENAMTVMGPMPMVGGGIAIIVRNPIFVRTDNPNDTFGSPGPDAPFCGEPCAYNATTRTKFWGFAACVVSAERLVAPGSALSTLEMRGYAYEVHVPNPEGRGSMLLSASTARLTVDPLVVSASLPNTEWELWLAPQSGWTPSWRGGILVGVVLLSVIVGALLFAALVSRRQHQALLEAVLPKQMIRQMQAEDTSYLHARATGVDTPAELLLAMMRDLLEGNQPQLSDVVFIRTALLRNMDVYQPMNLKGYLRGSSLDADVVRSLMRQLDKAHDVDAESHSSCHVREQGASGGNLDIPGTDSLATDDVDCSTVPMALQLVFAVQPIGLSCAADDLHEARGSQPFGSHHDRFPSGNTGPLRSLDDTNGGRHSSGSRRTPQLPMAGSRLVVPAPASVYVVQPSVVEEVERMLAQVDSWHFNTWRLQDASQGHALSVLGFYLIQRAGLMQRHRIKPVVLARLLRQIEAGYKDNPYHNSTHAADVLQTLHVIIHSARLHVHYLDSLGLLGAYYAAIVHDYAHPGVTGDFLVATSDPLAIRYNDRSPLENHHCAASFALLQQKDLNAFEHLSKQERTTMRKQVIELVLATDMKQHFSILSHFNTVHRLTTYQHQPQAPPLSLASPPTPSSRGSGSLRRQIAASLHRRVDENGEHQDMGAVAAPPQPLDEAERSLALQVALKCADLGHLGEDLSVHKAWLAVLEEEFFQQGDLERKLGIPISPLFDRSKQGVSKSQIGFYEFCGMPLVHALSTAFPGAAPLMRCFTANYQHWRNEEGKTSSRSSFVKPLPAASLAAPSNSTRAGKPPLTPATLEPTVQVVLEDAEERL